MLVRFEQSRMVRTLENFVLFDKKCPIGKSIFAVILPLKLFCTIVASADIRHSANISSKMFVPYACEI